MVFRAPKVLASMTLAFILGGLSFAAGDTTENYIASTEDNKLRAFVSARLIRSAFATFCETVEEEVCDSLDRYNIQVVVDHDRPMVIWFLLPRSSSDETGSLLAREFGCELLSEGLNCGSTRQRAH